MKVLKARDVIVVSQSPERKEKQGSVASIDGANWLQCVRLWLWYGEKKLRGNEKGVSLMEMLVVLAILGAIMGVMSMTVITIMKASKSSNDQAIVLRQVQTAGYWISRDVQRAHDIDNDVTAPNFLILTWIDWDYSGGGSSIYHTVTYMLEDMSGGTKKLVRRHQDSVGTDEQILIAEHIYYDLIGDPGNSTKVIGYESPALTLRITAAFGGAMTGKIYEASRRPNFSF